MPGKQLQVHVPTFKVEPLRQRTPGQAEFVVINFVTAVVTTVVVVVVGVVVGIAVVVVTGATVAVPKYH